MSEQETVQMENSEQSVSEQSLAESINELETLTQQALELDGEAREDILEQIKTKCEQEGLSSEETESLLEEIGLVQESRKVKESKSQSTKQSVKEKALNSEADEEDDDEDEDDDKSDKKKPDQVETVVPKTKSGAINSVYEKLGKLRKDTILANYDKIMKAINEDVENESPVEEVQVSAIDVKEDIDALVNGEELSEEFKEKAATIFEAAVQAKVNEVVIQKQVELEEQYEEKIQESLSTYRVELEDQIDGYLNYVTQQWLEENKLAVEKGVRTEITEQFIEGLKNLFNENYINIPDEKVDVVDDLFEKVETLEKQLNEEMDKNVQLNQQVVAYKKEKIINSLTENLASTQAEKVKQLAESVEVDNIQQYEEKVKLIKENYFPAKQQEQVELIEEVHEGYNDQETQEPAVDNVMKNYLSAISKTVR